MVRSANIAASFRDGAWIDAERVRGYSLLLLILFSLATVALWTTGHGRLDVFGRPIGTDFSNMYAAGSLAVEGRPAAAYDLASLFAEQAAVTGQSEHLYGWHYPPIFFLIAAPLAALSYMPALILWLAAGFVLYLLAIWAILPRSLALLAAAAFPAVFVTVGHGQNAFLTAGLLGLGLVLLERRPWLAGFLLGCLCFKPHLGLVLPIVLVAARQWKPFLGAAIAVVLLCALSAAAFGLEPWRAFLASGEVTRTIVLEQTATGWFKIQSLFSAVRGFGGSVAAAYVAQGVLSLAVLAMLVRQWVGGSSPGGKAAVAIGALLVTPYVLDYDMLLIAPAVAFLVAPRLESGFRPYEKALLAAAWIAPLLARPAAQFLHLPLGLLVMLALFALACAERPPRAVETQPPKAIRRIS
jgi:Glycosyltransferase family 87